MSAERQSEARLNCSEVERLLDPWLDGELDGRDQAELLRHLDGCRRCRPLADERAADRTMLRAKLREAMGPGTPAGTAPESLRERIAAALDRQRPPLWRRALSPVPLGALAAAAAGVLVVLASHGGMGPLADEAVAKHLRDLPLEVNAATVAPDAIPAALANVLDFNPRPPPFQAQGLRLVGARTAHLRDRPAAYMRYETPRGRMGLFIVVDPERSLDHLAYTVQLGPPAVRVLNARGYNVAVWRENEMVYSLVSDLDEADLKRLVENARVQPSR